MTTQSAKRIYLPRQLSPDGASALVGHGVDPMEPTLTGPTIVHDADTREAVLAYLPLDDPGPFRRALLQVKCDSTIRRQRNYTSKSKTFGFSPRRPIVWREACQTSNLAQTQPAVERALERYADQFSAMLDYIDPGIIGRDKATLGDVLPEWRFGEAKLWTSGVINDTAQLPYHRDGFNFPTWSAMPVMRRATRGGYLHLPEYGVVVPCADSTVTYFPGKVYVHGVTPIRRLKKDDGYRISVVYYALQGMKNCREAAEETAFGVRKRSERESDMAQRLRLGDRGIKR